MKTLKNILFLFLATLLFNSISYAQGARGVDPVEPINVLTVEKWAKFTCRGPSTPKGITPIVYKDILSAHFRVGSSGFPTATMLYDQSFTQLQAVTDLCSTRRWQRMDLTGWTGNEGHTTFLDWETDHLYERYTLSAVEFDPQTTPRTVGKPCDKTTVCASTRSENLSRVRCNTVLNTCEQ